MALMPRNKEKFVPAAVMTKQYLDRVHNAVQRRPALSENKLVFQVPAGLAV